jgi:predicted thioesterase
MDELKPGLKGELMQVVTEQDTASRYRSGLVVAFATPALVALMESASVVAIHKYLSSNQTSVGVEVNIKHLAPTPVGMSVLARAELLEVNGNRLRFKLEAWDDKEKVGEGTHVRAIINSARFAERLKQKSTPHLS